jgi:arginyl-tRNA synthetase
MSKRAGNFITAREVIDEVGADVLRFIMLTRKNDAPLDFDLAKVIEQSKDNPIFYVQYAHARCCSVLRQAPAVSGKWSVLSELKDESEIELIKKIANFSRVIEMAVTHFEPHRIAFYLQELAAEFHSLWNKGMENPGLKFIISDKPELTQARLGLVMATRKIIAEGLKIFNIKALEEM